MDEIEFSVTSCKDVAIDLPIGGHISERNAFGSGFERHSVVARHGHG